MDCYWVVKNGRKYAGGAVAVAVEKPFRSDDAAWEAAPLQRRLQYFTISVICTRFNSPGTHQYPDFTFHVISDSISDLVELNDVELFFSELNKSCTEPLRECLSGILSTPTSCLITDTFWYSSQAVANSFGLPRFVLDINMSFFLTAIEYQNLKHLSTEDKEAQVQEVLPLKIKDLPMLKARDQTLADEVIPSMLREIKASKGIIFNSFDELEPHALAKVKDALSVPVFTCGPMHLFSSTSTSNSTTPTGVVDNVGCIIPWLDTHALKSVLYISLGTLVSMEESEFLELAWGIAASEQPFLWSVRPGLVRGCGSKDGYCMLPEEFMGAIEGRGLVVSWVPQQDVLAHPSVGGFWTHAGWNSILESIHAGIPMICLPFLGDQMSNARYVSDVWKIGIYYEEDKVERCQVDKAIRRLMVDKEGFEMRKKATSWKNKANQCVEVGGSSYKSLDKLVHYVAKPSSSLHKPYLSI